MVKFVSPDITSEYSDGNVVGDVILNTAAQTIAETGVVNVFTEVIRGNTGRNEGRKYLVAAQRQIAVNIKTIGIKICFYFSPPITLLQSLLIW